MNEDLAARLLLALAIGLVVGIERGWRERDVRSGGRTAGVRTFALSGLLGGVVAAVATAAAAPLLIGLGFIGFSAVFAWFKRAEAAEDHDLSATGTIAAMLVFSLGALAVIGDVRVAGAAGVAVAGVLACREYLHGLMRKLTWNELRSFFLLLAMSVIVLPLLPDVGLGPYDAIRPRQIWIFTILVATVSYVGYVAMRLLGTARGLLVTSLAGGLVSSTAIAFDFARRSTQGEPAAVLAAGASVAGAVSILRILTLVSLVQPSLGAFLVVPILAAAVVFVVPAVLIIARGAPASTQEMALGNPFELLPLFGFAVLLTLINVLAAWLTHSFGGSGLLGLALISGLVDVDAVSLSSARMAGESVEMIVAAKAILLALLSNALARAAYGAVLGTTSFSMPLGAITLAACAAGAAGLFLS